MPKVTHLTDTFYDDLEKITTHLQEGLLHEDYKRFYKLVKRKDLAGATRYLEGLYEEYTEIDVYTLARLRKREAWNVLYRYVLFRIEMCHWLMTVTMDWIRLMVDNGGSKKAGKLARAEQRKLPAAKPWMCTPNDSTADQ